MEYATLSEYDIDISEIILIHKYEFAPNTITHVYPNRRASYGLVYIIDGQVDFVFKNSKIHAEKNSILFMPSNSSYSVENKELAPFLHYTVNFAIAPGGREGILNKYLTSDHASLLNSKNHSMFESMFSKILSIWSNKKSGFVLRAKAELYTLIYEFFEELERSRINRKDYERINPAKLYIDENYTTSISTKHLSAMCGLSDTHFRRLFNEIFHIPPLEYQINLRIMKAKDLLLTDIYSIYEISEMCGFSDPNYFSRTFKYHVGISPVKYKKMH